MRGVDDVQFGNTGQFFGSFGNLILGIGGAFIAKTGIGLQRKDEGLEAHPD